MDIQRKIGLVFAIVELGFVFWWYLIMIIIASFERSEERSFIVLTWILWVSVKGLQITFLLVAGSFKKRPTKKVLKITRIFLVLYILTFAIGFLFSAYGGFDIVDWVINPIELLLLLNMLYIYKELRRPDVREIMMSNERDMEIEKEKLRIFEQKQRIEGGFIVFDPSLHLETIESPHEQLDIWKSKNKHLKYYEEVNPFDMLYEQDLENYQKQFERAQTIGQKKVIDAEKGAIPGIVFWTLIVLVSNTWPLFLTIRKFASGNAGFWQNFHLVLLTFLLLTPPIAYRIAKKKGAFLPPTTYEKIIPTQRSLVQFYESETELIMVQADSKAINEHSFAKEDVIGLRDITHPPAPIRKHLPKNRFGDLIWPKGYKELVLQYFDGDNVETHKIIKLDDETFEMMNPSIEKLREVFKADFGRDKSRFRGPNFRVCSACNEIALATDKFCDDCGTQLI